MTARITGMGLVSPLGVGVAAYEEALSRGLRSPTVFETDFDAETYTDPRTLRKVSGLTRLVTVATALCLEQADLSEEDVVRDQTSVLLGNCFGSSNYHLEYHEALRRHGLTAASALLFAESVFNAASSHVAKVHRLRGANLTLVGGEAVGLQAITMAADRIRLGSVAVLAGGAEESASLTTQSLMACGLVDQRRPFAEGAAMMLLQSGNGPALARVLGSGRSRDGVASARRLALEDAGVVDVDREIDPGVWTGQGFAFTSAARAALGVLEIVRGAASKVLVIDETSQGSAVALVLGCG